MVFVWLSDSGGQILDRLRDTAAVGVAINFGVRRFVAVVLLNARFLITLLAADALQPS
jgi:hypothetical protein